MSISWKRECVFLIVYDCVVCDTVQLISFIKDLQCIVRRLFCFYKSNNKFFFKLCDTVSQIFFSFACSELIVSVTLSDDNNQHQLKRFTFNSYFRRSKVNCSIKREEISNDFLPSNQTTLNQVELNWNELNRKKSVLSLFLPFLPKKVLFPRHDVHFRYHPTSSNWFLTDSHSMHENLAPRYLRSNTSNSNNLWVFVLF